METFGAVASVYQQAGLTVEDWRRHDPETRAAAVSFVQHQTDLNRIACSLRDWLRLTPEDRQMKLDFAQTIQHMRL